MFFNSIDFLIFFPLVALLYFTLPLRLRRPLIIAAGFVFYWFFSVKLSLLLVYTMVQDYTVARLLGRTERPGLRKALLICSLTGNLGLLATFKYLDFLSRSVTSILGFPVWPEFHLLLPMGISFYTFQTMAYTIDVYRRRLPAWRSFLDFACYVTFFPQLVAGPIMRGEDLLPQFAERHEFNADRVLSGVLLMTWGLLKKVFVADPIGALVDTAYGTGPGPWPHAQYSGLALLVASYGFAVQIYADFSAYSDIAIGAARVLGFRLMKNFDSPYLAISIRDFWRRWHISLSTWLRDYLYIPLGGNRGTQLRTYVNLMATMLLGGLWHGANWTFVIWGALHGLYLAGERWLGIDRLERSRMSVLEQWIRGFITFHLVCLAWVFFRARTAAQAFEVLGRIVRLAPGETIGSLPLVALGLLVAVQIAKARVDVAGAAIRVPRLSRWVVYAGVALLVVALAGGRSPEFIYFQF
jgi:D-alanyl-lipoteichoic acid acyltransferase DltB (MBOAT superfamily)